MDIEAIEKELDKLQSKSQVLLELGEVSLGLTEFLMMYVVGTIVGSRADASFVQPTINKFNELKERMESIKKQYGDSNNA